jgi:outer membrane protein OmpA-like peptidoglycan-associated protein
MAKLHNTIICFVLLALVLVSITACVHTTPIPDRTMEFEQGINALASNIADQLEKSSIRNMLNKVVINPLTKQKQLKKIVIDPFIEVESGYPVKANIIIKDLISKKIGMQFAITGEMDPENLEVSEYVLNGMVTLENKMGEQEKAYKVFSTVFEKDSGKVLASASVYINSFDTTPMDIYKDSPVFLKGKNYQDHVASVRKNPDDMINQGYNDRLRSKAMLVKGDMLYEKHEFNKSLAYYNQVAGGQKEQELEVLNGQFTNLVKQEHLEEAELVYAKLLKTSITETNEIANKIIFAPNSVVPLESNISLYKIYIRQIANLVAAAPACRVQIIGHSSRSGSESYNDKLSQQRAEWIQNQMAVYAPKSRSKSETIGRGFRENIIGSGKDDITDAIDRRVEFKFSQNEVAENEEIMTTPEEKHPPINDSIPKVSNVEPLKLDNIEYYLKNKVSNKVIASLIAERGVNFELNDKIKKRLKKIKADERVFKAINEANASNKRNDLGRSK